MTSRIALALCVVGCVRTDPSPPQRAAFDPPAEAAEDTEPEIPKTGTFTSERPEIGVLHRHESITDLDLCTGALVAPKVVLTAAHCVDFRSGRIVTEFVIGGVRASIVEAYSLAHDSGYDDLAVLRLAAPVTGAFVPLRLARSFATGETVTMWGYGCTDPTQSDAGIKRVRTATVVDDDGIPRVDTKDICHGDSGGPMLNARGEIIAVVSASFRDDRTEIWAPIGRSWDILDRLVRHFEAAPPGY